MSLTDRQVAALPFPKTGQKIHTDSAIPGFGVRISQGGAKTFVLTVGAERRRITIGRYPIVSLAQAREKARTILAKRQLGLDHQLTPFFAEARDQYLASREGKIRSSTARRDASVLHRFSSLSKKRVADITPADVQNIINRIRAPPAHAKAVARDSNLIRNV